MAKNSALRFVRPAESDELLVNPGMGFCTYQRFNGDRTVKINFWKDDGPTEYSDFSGRLENEDFPDTSVAYLRWNWMRLEPEQGTYRWDIIDRALEQAGKRGQQLHFRVMPNDGSPKIPEWFKRGGRVLTHKTDKGTTSIPDYRHPLYRRAMERLVGLMGERYDGHRLLCGVDIGTLGLWGEWHAGRVPGNPMGDEAFRRWAIDLYLQAFRRTPLMMLIAPVDGMAYATSHGTGWRADCWGDMRPRWGHMYDCYPANVARSGATEAWRRGPVCLETCWTFLYWFRKGWDVDFILEEALRRHATHINAKSSIIPAPWRGKVREFQKRLGYRYTLRTAGWPPEIAPGEPLRLEHWWVNRGVAPCYAGYRLLLRLRGAGRDIVAELPHDLRRWMPGDDQYCEDEISFPGRLPCGAYELLLGIARAGEKTPAVKMANRDRDAEGWLPVGAVQIQRTR